MNVQSKIRDFIDANEEFTMDEIEYIMYKTENRNDYLLLNYIEQKIIENYGKNFIEDSENKIGLLLDLLMDDNKEGIYNFYKKAFEEYMKICQYKFENITSFNLIFLTHCHIALKILRLQNS